MYHKVLKFIKKQMFGKFKAPNGKKLMIVVGNTNLNNI